VEHHVRTEIAQGLGLITLDRPAKINALTPGMVEAVASTMRAWRYSREVDAVVLRGEGERGFCAGGDLAGFHSALREGREEEFLDVLAAEFELAADIASYPKPVVAFMHGLTLGAGLGLAGAAAVRIVTPDARLGMPEARIGYVPDVGGSLLLARAPGRMGEHLAATGDAVAAGDAVEFGLADFCIAPGTEEDVVASLVDFASLGGGEVGVALEVVHGVPAPASTRELSGSHAWIDHCYAREELADVLAELGTSPWPEARAAGERVAANSPLAAATAIELVRAARDEDELRGALEREHRAAAFMMERPDLAEGIRARIIDKDDAPRWDPADAGAVDVEVILRRLEPEEEEDW